MEITATSIYDQKVATALYYLVMFKGHNPKKRMILFTVLDALLIALSILELIFLDSKIPIICLFLGIALLFMQYYMYLLLPKIRYRAMGKLADSRQTYKFTDDTVFFTSSVGEYEGSGSTAYNMLYRVMETGEYLFLFINKRQAYIVDKSTVQGGTVAEIRAKFTDIPGFKYIVCKY